MVVRERRRVTSLAKAASSLDERLQAAEKALSVSEAAMRTCMDEHRQDVADLEQRQHDQISCLVEMVKESADQKNTASEDEVSNVAMFHKKLLVLANERVSL
jgi:ABC-type transporter Mla subunit MlaD